MKNLEQKIATIQHPITANKLVQENYLA